ncbi:hypothetical protein BGP_3548 [Beggiatoa sp. PS]|nr:hypothetical protein BGP_3548 [Beggiatoa sp. PS]
MEIALAVSYFVFIPLSFHYENGTNSISLRNTICWGTLLSPNKYIELTLILKLFLYTAIITPYTKIVNNSCYVQKAQTPK